MGKSPAYLVFLICKDSSQAGGLADSEMRIKKRMSNVEGMYSGDFIKKTEQSETTLRNSAVRCSLVLRFAVCPSR